MDCKIQMLWSWLPDIGQEEVVLKLATYFRSRNPYHRTRSFERTALLPMVVLLTSMFFLHPAL